MRRPVGTTALVLGPAALFLAATACRAGYDNGVYAYNSPPAVSITAPTDDTTFEQGQAVTFRGVVSDDAGIDALELEWHSAIDGVLEEATFADADGNVELVLANLSIGHHVVSLRALDEQAELGEDRVTVHIEGSPEVPSITVERPSAGDQGGEGIPYRFTVRVDDPQDDPSMLLVNLDSNAHGHVCEMFPDSAGVAWCDEVLPLGPHMLTFTVEDTDGNTASANANFEVVDPDDLDADGDGFSPNGGDCNDANHTIYPGAPEICDGLDNDCNPATPIDVGTDCTDDDGDGYTEYEGDCDDGNPNVHPGATELPNNRDDDCDGDIDEGTVRYDDDGDGYCESPPCVNAPGTMADCNDADFMVNPGQPEVCGDGIDNDCDGRFTEKDAIGCTLYYYDKDGDGYGVPSSSECHCDGGQAPYTGITADDCYDNNAKAHPGQTQWFTTHRGDGRYDYNCDYNDERRWVNVQACDLDFYFDCNDAGEGWTSAAIPNCGSVAEFAEDCSLDVWYDFMTDTLYTYCELDDYNHRAQQCR